MTTDTTIRARIDAILPELIAFRRDLHAHPELGYQEETNKQRRAAGAERRRRGNMLAALPEALVCWATYPALRLAQSASVPTWMPCRSSSRPGFRGASTHEGCMHACGHDGHTAILVGAARVLGSMAREGALPNPINFLFQPAEEGGGGGERMVEDGCLDGRVLGPSVARMYGLHGWPVLPQNMVSSRPGPMLAAADRFRYHDFRAWRARRDAPQHSGPNCRRSSACSSHSVHRVSECRSGTRRCDFRHHDQQWQCIQHHSGNLHPCWNGQSIA